LEIKVIGNDVEGAIKLLKRKIQRDGLLRDLKERRFYEKPSVKTKRKQREAQKRKRKSIRMRSQSRSAGKPS
jgi:small subunit ribosomal protein S21